MKFLILAIAAVSALKIAESPDCPESTQVFSYNERVASAAGLAQCKDGPEIAKQGGEPGHATGAIIGTVVVPAVQAGMNARNLSQDGPEIAKQGGEPGHATGAIIGTVVVPVIQAGMDSRKTLAQLHESPDCPEST